MSENKFISRLKGKASVKSLVEIQKSAIITPFSNIPNSTPDSTFGTSDSRDNSVVMAKSAKNWIVNNSALSISNSDNYISEFDISGNTLWLNSSYIYPASTNPDNSVVEIIGKSSKWVFRLCGKNLLSNNENISFTLAVKIGATSISHINITTEPQAGFFCKQFEIDFSESDSDLIKVSGGESLVLQLLCNDATANATIYNGKTTLTLLQRKVDSDAVSSETMTFDDIEQNVNQLIDGLADEIIAREQADEALQDNIDTVSGDLASHIEDTDNPHATTAAQVGLGNVDNTSDADKPISTAAAIALGLKVDKVAGKELSTNDLTDELKGYYDTAYSHSQTTGNPHGTTKSDVGLGNVDNTSDADKPISDDTQDALDDKADLSGASFSGNITAPNIIAGNTIYGGTVSDNLDTINKSGFYTCYGTATGVPSVDYSWFVIHQNSNVGTASATQRAVAYDSTTLRVYERVKTSSTWGAWNLQGSADGGGASLSAGMSLFGLYEELPSAAYVWGDAGKQELNNASTNYSNLVDNITGGLIPSDTIAAWDAAYASNPDNAVPFWGYDSVTDKVIVPNIPRGYGMTAAGSLANVGTVLQNAAPNITGGGAIAQRDPIAGYGAFGGTIGGGGAYAGGGYGVWSMNFDASRSNAAYGRDSTTRVRGDQIQMRVMFYVGAEVSPQEASQITAAGVLADVAALNGLTGQGGATPMSDYVIETATGLTGTGYTAGWYRKYKSGWVEQGGRGKDTITLPIKMASSTYYCLATRLSGGADAYCSILEVSATQISVKISIGTAAFWEVKGMAA